MTKLAIQRLYVRGHNYDGEAMLSGNKRGLSSAMKRELKRRSAIEPMIGHAKNDGWLGRNHLLGADGDKINAILAAAHNLRLAMRRLTLLFARTLATVFSIFFTRNHHKGRHNSPQRINGYMIETDQDAASIP